MASYKFFQNRECEYFPCHSDIEAEAFNCLFCFCPLYALGERCGGCFRYIGDGIKDCSGCLRPHRKENYDDILNSVDQILDIAKRNTSVSEKT